MSQPVLSPPVIRFEVFEFELRAGELRKRGRKLKLQEQPFRVLAMLLERPGEVIPREELRQKLWPADTSLPPVEVVPLVGLPGYEVRPAFSPDGNQVAFLQFGGQENTGIYTTLVGGEKSLRLTKNPNDCCVTWSPDCREVSFLRFAKNAMDIYVVPALGG